MSFLAGSSGNRPKNFPVYRKAESAHKEHGSQINYHVVSVITKTVPPKQIDAGIAESRYRMKNAVPDAFHAKLGNKNKRICDGADSFQAKRYL